MMNPSNDVDLGRRYNSLFEFKVVHRYVFIVVQFCQKIVQFRPVLLKLFSIAPFSLSTHRCRLQA